VRDVFTELMDFWRAGQDVAVATVVQTWSSAPRQPGAAMIVAADASVVGSVSGGCVEGAVYELASQVRQDGLAVLQRYGVSDDDAFAVGLTCGGIIDIFLERVGPTSFPELGGLAEDIAAARPVAVATVIANESAHGPPLGARMIIRPDSASGGLGSQRLNDAVRDDARGLLEQGRTAVLHYGPDGERRVDEISVFVSSFAPRPRMIVFGAIDFAASVARMGSFLGYHVTVCDARPIFATRKRFPDADEVVVQWPHHYLAETAVDERTVVCVLTHDPKFDVPLLEIALRLPLAYVGAMGSRRTNDDRMAKLRDRGLSEAELARLHAPIGLDIGARTPEETAASVAAEIIATRWGGSGTPLTTAQGPIHRDLAPAPAPKTSPPPQPQLSMEST
jgi:xanthine dehydrogenase accessory factor